MIRSIPTLYKGFEFRSRLEAQWAYYFDLLKIKWVYEPVTLEFTDEWPRGYIPDFYLPDLDVYVEVKGSPMSVISQEKAKLLTTFTQKPLLWLDSYPQAETWELLYPSQQVELKLISSKGLEEKTSLTKKQVEQLELFAEEARAQFKFKPVARPEKVDLEIGLF